MDGQYPETKEELQREILSLPPGYISVKVINGKERYYHQWYEGGRQHTKYVRAEDLPKLKEAIDRRRELQTRLDAVRDAIPDELSACVVTGEGLRAMAASVEGMDRRDCYARLDGYIRGHEPTVCIIYGLRRTGKTVLTYQAIADMDDDRLSRTAYVTVGQDTTMNQLRRDLTSLRRRGYDTFFVDEVTRLRDFVDSSYYFPDVLAATGARVILTGTDSLGFWIASGDDLYGKAVTIHTTHIPYREHSRLMGIGDVDDYIRYGGVLRGGEMTIEDPTSFRDAMVFEQDAVDDYVGVAISDNIERTLERSRRYEGFGPLYEVHRAGEFRNLVNRVLQDLNHRFVLSVLEAEFYSHDLDNVVRNLDQRGIADLDGRTSTWCSTVSRGSSA